MEPEDHLDLAFSYDLFLLPLISQTQYYFLTQGESAPEVSFLSHRLEQRRVDNGIKEVNKANQQGIFTKSYFTCHLEM